MGWLSVAQVTQANLSTGSVLFGRWSSVLASLAILVLGIGAYWHFIGHKVVRLLIGIGTTLALIALGMRIGLLFVGTG